MATLPQMIFYGALMMRHAPAFRKQTRMCLRPAHAKMYDRAAGLPVGVAIGFSATIKGRRALKESIHDFTPISRWDRSASSHGPAPAAPTGGSIREELAVVCLSAAPGPIRWHYRQKINAMVYQAIIE